MHLSILVVWLGLLLVPALAQLDDDDDFPDFGEAEAGTAKPTRAAITRGPCENRHRRDVECDNWAVSGHCRRNLWMKVYCASSCNTCHVPRRGDCPNDYNDHDCEIWAHAGHCSIPFSKPFMHYQCARSCNSCEFRRRHKERLRVVVERDEKTGAKTSPDDDDEIGGFDGP